MLPYIHYTKKRRMRKKTEERMTASVIQHEIQYYHCRRRFK